MLITFDTHTPYLAFRVRALQAALQQRKWDGVVRLQVVLIALEETSYQWQAGELSSLYGGVPVRVLTDKFRGLRMRDWFRWTTFKTTCRMAWHYLKLRPRIALVGGYDRPESMALALLSILTRGKVGPLHDSRFNDAESHAKNIRLELVKSFILRRYDFFMCSGRECADYSRFLGGRDKPAFTSAWDIVDNEEIGRLADRTDRDDVIRKHLGLNAGEKYFFMPIRFLPKKNAALVLDAYAAAVRRAGPSAETFPHLVLCGQGPLQQDLSDHIRRLDLGATIHMASWLPYDEVPRASRLSLALLLASTHDQWGMTINEGLAAGTPVICSSRAGAHEIVRNYCNGFTFHPWDSEHLTSLFLAFAADPQLSERLRSNAAASVRSFSVDQWLEACFRVIERFGGPGKAPPDAATGAESAQ